MHGYANPARFLKALVAPKNRRGYLADAGMQLLGMVGWVRNLWLTPAWLYHLTRGRIVRYKGPPASPFPFRGPTGGPAAHAVGDVAPPRVDARREHVTSR